MSKITVFGTGSWGTALAIVLADNNHDVYLWGRSSALIDEINEQHTNKKYLKNASIPKSIYATVSIEDAVSHAEIFLIVVPTAAMREVLKQINSTIQNKTLFIHASKGIEPESHLRISQLIEEEIDSSFRRGVVALSGPSHAEEVCERQPTTITSSSENLKDAEEVQDIFMNQYLRVYTNPDLIGVEIGGSLKNIIAIGTGMTNGLGFGDNAKAALMTRGLAEIARLGMKMGADPITFAGLAGLGDLIVTCTSEHSRNLRAGKMLGNGKSLDEVLSEMGMVVEGIRTTKAAYQLAEKYEVDMPITKAIYDVLFNQQPAKVAVQELMGRVRKHEVEDLKLQLEE